MPHDFKKTTSNEIKPVVKFFKDSGEFLLKCPHCDSIRGISDEFGSIKKLSGEQYQDNLCDGWYYVSNNPTLVSDIEKL
jgi:hypothetical protein